MYCVCQVEYIWRGRKGLREYDFNLLENCAHYSFSCSALSDGALVFQLGYELRELRLVVRTDTSHLWDLLSTSLVCKASITATHSNSELALYSC